MKKHVFFRNGLAMLLAVAMMVGLLSGVGSMKVYAETSDNIITPAKPEGDGTAENPYQIGTAEELYWFADKVNNENRTYKSASAVLTNDITVNTNLLNSLEFDAEGNVTNGDNLTSWIPIGGYDVYNSRNYAYIGNFDGQNHTISGLYFNDSNANYVGLFGYSSGSISNVGIVDSNINGYNYVGSVCGSNRGTIENCYNTGSVRSTNYYAGGVCGFNGYGGTIKNCYNTGVVIGENRVGGVCGDNYEGTIKNCYNTGTVSGSNEGIGGVCGYSSYNSAIENCYNIGTVSSLYGDGGVCGYNDDSTIENSYFLEGSAETGIGTGSGSADSKTAAEFANGTVCGLLGYHSHKINGICILCSGDYEAARQNSDGYYEISNVGQLYWFAGLVDGTLTDGTTQNLAANAVLTADITVNEGVLDAGGNLASDTTGFKIWTPLCRNVYAAYKSYTGTFDGKGHIISGLYAPSDSDFCGFFAECNGTIKNLGITNSFFGGSVWGCYHTATFAGYGYSDCVIENCFSISVINGGMYCGGIAGVTRGTIRNCYFAGKISASTYSNAIVSDENRYGTLSNCYYLDTCGLTSYRATSKTAQEFASGEVAYRLQGEQAEPVWGQNLAEDSKQAYPVFFGTPVYKVGTYQGCEGNPGDATYFYSNTNENAYASHIDDGSIEGSVPYDNKCDICGGNVHHFVDGICDVDGCGYHEGVIVNETYPTEIVYGDEAIIPSADEFEIKSGATPTFTWYQGDVTSGELPTDGDEAFLGDNIPKDAGDYTLVVNAAGAKLNDENGTVYTAAELRIKVTIVKADATVTGVPVAAANLTYDQGNAITLIDDSKVSYIGGTELQYALGADGTYSTSLPTATDAGTYDVYYKVVGDGNHNDTTPVKIEVTVKRADSSIVFTGYTPGREYNRKPLDNPTAEQLTLTGAEYSDVTFTWYKDSVTEENKLTEAPTDAGDYYVVALIPQSINYNASSRESEKITISRTTPKYTTPTDVKAICGNMLSKVELPEGFSWTDTDVALEAGDLEAGAQITKKAKYVPTDITNYKEVTDIEISIQVMHDLSATQLEGNEGAEKHISKCSACGNSFNETACSGGTATCTDRAVCSVCNKPYGTVDADNHSFTKYVSEHDATCVVNGHETAACDYGCGKKNTKIAENSLLGHSYIETFNWTEDGLACTVTFTCDREGCTEDTEGHSVSYDCTVTSNVKIPATCTAKGTTTYTAAYTYNGKTYTDTKDVEDIAKVDHTFGEWVVTKQATEDEKGEKEKSCSCGYKITAEIEKLAHTIHVKDEGTRVEPTCEENGSITYKCKKCGEVIEVVVLDAVGHNWDNGKVTKEATKTAEGIKTYTCTVCGKTKTQSIPKKKAGEEKQLKKGDVVTDDKRAARVKVADVKKKEVEYKEPVNKKAKTVTIPATVKINGTTYKVTKISDNAFKGNKIVTRITVGKNIKSIGKNVFSGTTKLKTITLKTTKLTQKTVSRNAFKGISKSATIKVPKKKLSAYKKLFKSKGLSSKVKVKGY